jgi:hypothetical protein
VSQSARRATAARVPEEITTPLGATFFSSASLRVMTPRSGAVGLPFLLAVSLYLLRQDVVRLIRP